MMMMGDRSVRKVVSSKLIMTIKAKREEDPLAICNVDYDGNEDGVSSLSPYVYHLATMSNPVSVSAA
jgi:hypothetical protein